MKTTNKKTKTDKELNWNVFRYDMNKREIVQWNIFNHYGFCKDLYKIKKKYNKEEFENEFKQEIKRSLQYYFWSKSEYEIILSNLFPKITKEEVERLEARKKNGSTYFFLEDFEGEKIDIFNQILLNEEKFLNYVWDNRRLIKRVV